MGIEAQTMQLRRTTVMLAVLTLSRALKSLRVLAQARLTGSTALGTFSRTVSRKRGSYPLEAGAVSPSFAQRAR